jgi:hypothetical protein
MHYELAVCGLGQGSTPAKPRFEPVISPILRSRVYWHRSDVLWTAAKGTATRSFTG